MGPSDHCSHTGDLSAVIDIAGRDDGEVRILGNQHVQVGHYTVLPNEAVGPIVAGVNVVSHHLAPVVDAGSEGGSISRQKAEDGERAVRLPKRGYEGAAISAADFPDSLPPVVNGEGEIGSGTSKILKHGDRIVSPDHGVARKEAVSRVAYGLAAIVDAVCETIWIGTYQRKNMGLSVFPQHRYVSGEGRAGGVSVGRFCKSDDLSAVVDGAGLPIVAACSGESAHVAVSPKKRNAGEVCAKAANIFAVRV